MSIFTTDTPKNIDSMTKGQLIEWIVENSSTYSNNKLNGKEIGSLMLEACKLNGLDISNEQFLFIMDNSSRILDEACAGSGKTTVSQMKLICEKMVNNIPGYRILALAYNEHSAKDMELKHLAMVGKIVAKDKKKYFDIDTTIRTRTFHSFARGLVEEYKTLLGLENVNIAKPYILQGAMETAAKHAYKAAGLSGEIYGKQTKALYSIYQYIEESMIEAEDIDKTPGYKDCNMSVSLILEVFKKYEIVKQHQGAYDFIDYITYLDRLLETNQEARTRVQNMYQVILVDEYQDMSNRMKSILAKMLGAGTKLICIGDGDQAIYGFRGTNSLNCVNFKDDYNGGSVYTMSANRRCRKNIVEYGNYMIRTNLYRLEKSLIGVKDEGIVINKEFISRDAEFKEVIESLKASKGETCYVAFRTNESIPIFARYLLEENIPFRVKEDLEPFKDILTKHINSIIHLIFYPNNQEAIVESLGMLLPLKRDSIKKVVAANAKDICFYDMDYTGHNKIFGLDVALEKLRDISMRARNGVVMSNFFPDLFKLFEKYFWGWQRDQINFVKDLEDFIYGFYAQEVTFRDLNTQKQVFRERMKRFRDLNSGVTLSTMHGLKGLEFDRGFILELDENFPKDESASMSKSAEEMHLSIEEEMRLFYVAITRARNSLAVYWNKNSPSKFKAYAESFEELKANGGIDPYDFEESLDLTLDLGAIDVESEITEVSASVMEISPEDNLQLIEENQQKEVEVETETVIEYTPTYSGPMLEEEPIRAEDTLETIEQIATFTITEVTLDDELPILDDLSLPTDDIMLSIDDLPELTFSSDEMKAVTSKADAEIKAYDEKRERTSIEKIGDTMVINVNEQVLTGVVNVNMLTRTTMSRNERFIKVLSLINKGESA